MPNLYRIVGSRECPVSHAGRSGLDPRHPDWLTARWVHQADGFCFREAAELF
jgi:hypothetical protein